MLGLLRLRNHDKKSFENEDLTKDRTLLELINGFISYVKSIKIFDSILPPTNESASASLFPTTINYDKDILKNSSAIPCSTTQQPSKLLKYENIDGTITWKFNDSSENNQQATFSSLTSPFLTSTGSTVSGGEFSPSNNMNLLGQINSPSPISINNQINQSKLFSNSNSDLDSTHSLEEELAQIPDLPNPEFFDVQLKQAEDISSTSPSTSISSSNSHNHEEHGSSGKSSKVYTCEYCGSEFRIRGYLTRHIKKHAITKAYECPFFEKNSENKCHPNGGFSRRDTYKTHLKARHFKYPPGTKSQDRSTTAGKCGLCSKPYENNEEWVEKHIENGECDGLPKGFQIRVKNSRKKNYEFPDLNEESPSISGTPNKLHDDSSSTNESSNESPMPLHQHQSNPNQIKTLNEQDTINKKIIMSSLQFNHGEASTNSPSTTAGRLAVPNFHEYDENDEFSLDMEQCSYRPIQLSAGNGYFY